MFKETEKLNQLLNDLDSGEAVDVESPLSSLSEWKDQFKNELEFDEEFIEKFRAKFEDLISSPEDLVKLISSSLENQLQIVIDRNDNIPEFDQLLQLFEEVDSISPHDVETLIHNSGILTSSDNLLENYSFGRQLEELNGERLVKKIITIAPSLIEDSYKKYLHFLVTCKYIMDGKDKEPSNKLGVMLEQATSLKTKYPLLLDSDIGWLRNSTAHRNWKYNVESGKVHMTDNKNVEHSFSPEELTVKIMKPFLISSRVFYDASLYYKLSLFVSCTKKL